MNVTVENLAPCKKLVKIEIAASQVDETFTSVTKDYQRQASFPGFRPGKAPPDMLLRKFGKDIEDDVRRKLMSEAYNKALEEQKIDVVGNPDIEEIQFSRGQPLIFAATVETAPDFELPVYKGIPVKLEGQPVSESDVERALDALRLARANFATVPRPLHNGDVVVVNYRGTCEGKPITEIAPTAQGLSEKQNFWVEAPSTSFIPGFSDQLLGAKAGEKKTVTVTFPADFVTPQLAGKKADYDVEVVEVKERILPPVDDALAKSYQAESLEKLRARIRSDLESEVKTKQDRSIRNQMMRSLLDRVNFELPQSIMERETKNVVYQIVQENSKKGVTREAIEQHKDQIYSAATQGAKERLKSAYLLQRIAEKENIGVSQEEIADRINLLAGIYHIPPRQFAEDLKKRNGLIEIFDQILNEKVLDFLQQNARIEGADAPNPS